MLFLELMLIRWGAANVLYLAYFTNFVLLASFLGIGVGFLRARSPRDHFGQAPVVVAAALAFVALLPVQVDSANHLVGLFGAPALPDWISLPVIFVLVTAAMALVAEGVARTFATFPPLGAYRLDILGSLLGIAAFSGLAFLHSPPVVWGAVVAAAFLILLRGPLDQRSLPAAGRQLPEGEPASGAGRSGPGRPGPRLGRGQISWLCWPSWSDSARSPSSLISTGRPTTR